MIDRILHAILLLFAATALVAGTLGLLGIIRIPIPGNPILIGIGAVMNGVIVGRFALRPMRIKEPTTQV